MLGATSLIGRFLIPRLDAMGVETIALSRGPARRGSDTLRWLQADLDNPNLEAALPQIATVISLMPIWHLPGALKALRASGMTRLVAFSSTSVFTKAGSDDEKERLVALDLADGEAAVVGFCGQNEVAWTILRPTLIYAEGQDQNVTRLARLIRRIGFIPLYGKGEGRRQPVHADDLAVGALLAAIRPAAPGKTYDLPGGEILTYRLMVERIFQGLGRRPRVLAAPAWLWGLAFALARPVMKGASVQMGKRMDKDLVFKSILAEEDLSWSPRAFHPDFKKVR